MEAILETKAETILQFLRGLRDERNLDNEKQSTSPQNKSKPI